MSEVLYIEVGNKILAYIKENWLQSGDKLPTYRELARRFSVSVHTVSNAMERLQLRGMVHIRPQSGVYVMVDAWNTLYKKSFNWKDYFQKVKKLQLPFSTVERLNNLQTYYNQSKKKDYVLSNPVLSPEFDSFSFWKSNLDKVANTLEPDSLSYSIDKIIEICQVLSVHLHHCGINVHPDHIYPARGITHSLLYIATIFFSPMDICYYVSPSKLDASPLFDMCGLIKIPLPNDKEGIDINYFSSKINKGVRSFVIVYPDLGSGLFNSNKI
jgi:DNA-binding transcriptional MocR family regulator